MPTPSQLPRSTPEAQGVSSRALFAFIQAANANISELHSFMLLRHGQVVAEGWWAPYAPRHPHMLFSLSKSFTSTAVGLAVAEGRLSIDDFVLSFFPEDAPKRPSRNLQALRVRHLLAMVTGHLVDATEKATSDRTGNWVKGFFSAPVKHAPGAPFMYNSAASHLLSAIVQQVTGQPLLEYLTPRLFEPLGIQGMTWQTDPRGINTGGWGLALKTEDIARFGQLYLQKGIWNGRRLLSEAWVEQATSKQVDNSMNENIDWKQGYGFQFWRCRHNAYRGDGAFGQYCLVMPDQDAVLAITSGVADMQPALDLVWQHVLPALGPATLPADPFAQQALAGQLAGLNLALPQGAGSSPQVAKVSGQTYRFEDNPLQVKAIRLDFAGQACTLTIEDATGAHSLTAGSGSWSMGKSSLFQGDVRHALTAEITPRPVAAAYAWTAEDTLLIQARFYETPFYYTLTCKFTGDQLAVDGAVNVSFGPTTFPTLTGRL